MKGGGVQTKARNATRTSTGVQQHDVDARACLGSIRTTNAIVHVGVLRDRSRIDDSTVNCV